MYCLTGVLLHCCSEDIGSSFEAQWPVRLLDSRQRFRVQLFRQSLHIYVNKYLIIYLLWILWGDLKYTVSL